MTRHSNGQALLSDLTAAHLMAAAAAIQRTDATVTFEGALVRVLDTAEGDEIYRLHQAPEAAYAIADAPPHVRTMFAPVLGKKLPDGFRDPRVEAARRPVDAGDPAAAARADAWRRLELLADAKVRLRRDLTREAAMEEVLGTVDGYKLYLEHCGKA